MTSAAEVNPDTLAQSATAVRANTAALDDFLTVLLNVRQTGSLQVYFKHYMDNHGGCSFLLLTAQKFPLLNIKVEKLHKTHHEI